MTATAAPSAFSSTPTRESLELTLPPPAYGLQRLDSSVSDASLPSYTELPLFTHYNASGKSTSQRPEPSQVESARASSSNPGVVEAQQQQPPHNVRLRQRSSQRSERIVCVFMLVFAVLLVGGFVGLLLIADWYQAHARRSKNH